MDIGCEHSNRHDRVLFYRTLYRYSSLPIPDNISGKGGSQPVTDDELELLKEWVALSPVEIVRTLNKSRKAILLEQDEGWRKTILKEDHRLAIFAREHNSEDKTEPNQINNIFEYLESRRVLPFCCDCNDLRCICGEESQLTYIYNKTTHHVLAVGTTCIKSVRMASSDYKKCITCSRAIKGFTLTDMGQCVTCKVKDKTVGVKTGIKAGLSIQSAAADESYNPMADEGASLLDTAKILERRSQMCRRCKTGLNQGMMSDGTPGWAEGRLCMECIFISKPVLTEGSHAGEDAFRVALTLDSGPDDAGSEKGLIEHIREVYKWYDALSDTCLGFGKFNNLTLLTVTTTKKGYVSWCRDVRSPNADMRKLVVYADLRERRVAVTTEWPN